MKPTPKRLRRLPSRGTAQTGAAGSRGGSSTRVTARSGPPWVAAFVVGLGIAGPAAAQTPFPEPADARLAAGRTVWLGTCRDCHANSLSDAPQARDTSAWTARIARGRDALYGSALKGRVGVNGAEMPARGGNATLKDDEVRAAVDYMLFLVSSRKESK